jgi:hypothetical protein
MSGRKGRDGTTAVEVLVAAFILAVLFVGTCAYLAHARVSVLRQQGRRAALEASSTRMEEIRAAAYEDIVPPGPDTNVYYLSWQGTNWVHGTADPGETAVVGGRSLPITTTVQYRDLDGGPPSFDYLRITVVTRYENDQNDRVRLETFRAM